MRLLNRETQTPPEATERPFIDPMAARKAGYGPLHGPPAPGETIFGINSESATLAVESGHISVNGLRQVIVERRINSAEKKAGKYEKKAEKASKNARRRQNTYERIINGREIPFDERMDDMLPQTPLDKLDRLARKIRHPSRKPQPYDKYGAISSWQHGRFERKLLNKRAKRRMYEMDAEITYKRHAKPIDYRANNRDFSVVPNAETSDLGTELGWRRFYQLPRTGLERRGQVRAIESVDHAKHVAHRINEKAHRKVERAEAEAQRYEDKRTSATKKARKLENRKTTIINREDRVSKVYDSGKRRGKAYVKSRADEVKKDWKESMEGYRTAPKAFREGQAGTNVSDTRRQRALNRTAKRAGIMTGTVKREVKARLGKDPEAIARQQRQKRFERARAEKEKDKKILL